MIGNDSLLNRINQIDFSGKVNVAFSLEIQNISQMKDIKVGNKVPSYIFYKLDKDMSVMNFYFDKIDIVGDNNIKRIFRKIPVIRNFIKTGIVLIKASNKIKGETDE